MDVGQERETKNMLKRQIQNLAANILTRESDIRTLKRRIKEHKSNIDLFRKWRCDLKTELKAWQRRGIR